MLKKVCVGLIVGLAFAGCSEAPESEKLSGQEHRAFSETDSGHDVEKEPVCDPEVSCIAVCCSDNIIATAQCIEGTPTCSDGVLETDCLGLCSPEAGVDGTSEAGVDGGVATTLWHLPDQTDAFVLGIFPGGRFRWQVRGCDFGRGDYGSWRELEDGKIELIPEAPRVEFDWPRSNNKQTSVVASVLPSGQEIELVVDTNAETWSTGGQCPICGELGPVALEPCDAPFLPEQ